MAESGEKTSTGAGKPWWYGSQEGLSDAVLPPWEPLKLKQEGDGVQVEPWGREYAFLDAPFPVAVRSGKQPLLARPASVRAVVDGAEQEWQDASLVLKEVSDACVTLEQRSSSRDLELSVLITVEYDGMVRLDWKLKPLRQLTLEHLSFTLPLAGEVARYLYFYPGRWASTYNAGALPPEGLAMEFRPLLWLGDEETGLAWFCESDHNWLNEQSESAIAIRPEGGVVTLTLSLISQPVALAPAGQQLSRQAALAGQSGPFSALEYTFGLQATPVKPVVKDAWDYRLSHAGDYGIEALPPDFATLTYPANGNIELARGTLELWLKPVFQKGYQHGLQRPVVTLDLESAGSLRLFWRDGDGSLHFAVSVPGFDGALEVAAPAVWRQDEWHHVAVSWGEALRLYVDGALAAEREHEGLLEASLYDRYLVFGGPLCGFVVDEIRISRIARTPEEIGAAAKGGQPYDLEDMYTLLLDHLDNTYDPGNIEHLDSYGTFTRPVIAGRRFGGQAGRDMVRYVNGYTGMGLVDGSGRFVAGKYGYGLQLGGFSEAMLDRLAREGIRSVCFHEHWSDWQSYPYYAGHADEMRSLVRGCHERGVQLLLYYGFDFSALCPEFDEYHEECLVKPTHGGRMYTCTPAPQQRVATVCYNSVWQDAMVAGIARMMDEFGIDGVYLDGTANPHACANLKHGCGYVREDGSVAPTYPIFAVRRIMRRIYTVVKGRKPEGQVNVHQSTCMTIPTLAWATSLWDGEQFGHIEPGPHALTVLPLDAFRTEFMGHQWGLPQEFLCYERPLTYRQSYAVTLLHDVPVRAIGPGPNLDLISKLWAVFDDFGRKEAQWLPYWRNADYVKVSPEGVLASLYWRPGQGALAVVANLGRRAAQASVAFDLERLGMGAGVSVSDSLTGRELEIENGRLELPLSSMEWALLTVERQGGG